MSIQIVGLEQVLRHHAQLRGAQLEKGVAATLKVALTRLVVPPMRARAPQATHDMRRRSGADKYTTKSGTLKRSIGVRSLRKRPGEMAAYAVGPRTRKGNIATRAFYAGWVIRGTRAHIISVAGIGAGSRTIRLANRGGAANALSFNGHFAEVVHHPGARANPDFIHAGIAQVPAVKYLLLQQLAHGRAA